MSSPPWLARALALTLVMLAIAAPAFAQQPAGRPKLGLALSGGGARGLAHVGVLKNLEALGLRPDYIAGTSMGALVGGLYAAGYTPAQIEQIVQGMDWQKAFASAPDRRLLRYDQKDESQRYLFEVAVSSGGLELPAGILSGYKITTLLSSLCLPVAHIEDFDKLPIPYRAVATDIANGETVALSHGSLAQAMRASMSIPSVFPPFEIDGRLLVDGGITQNLPVDTVRQMGAQVVIAVNVSTPLREREKLKDLIDVMDQTLSLSMIRSTMEQAQRADLLITPELDQFTNSDFDKAPLIFARGEEAAQRLRQEILAKARAKGLALTPVQNPGVQVVGQVRVSKVSMEGDALYHSEVMRLAPYQHGQLVSVVELDESVQRLYGLGTFESVSYQVIPAENGLSEIRYLLKEKRLGLGLTRMGLRLGLNAQGSEDWQISFNLSRPNLIYSGSSAEMDILLGRTYGVGARLHMPNMPWEGLFLRPSVYYYSQLHDIYASREIRAQFTLERTGTSIDGGYYLGTWGEFTAGYFLEWDGASPRIATVGIEEFGERLAGVRTAWRLDALDRKPFPTSGLGTELELQRMTPHLWSEVDYARLSWRGTLPLPLAARHTLETNWTVSSALNSTPALTQVQFLGGYPGMLGYAFEEFFGQEIARLQLVYRWQMSSRLYLLLAGNLGSVWESLESAEKNWDDLRWGGGGGLALDTPFGPLALTLGLGERGRTNLYFNFGYGF